MTGMQERLADLRQMIAAIEGKHAKNRLAVTVSPLSAEPAPKHCTIEQWADGKLVSTPFGSHFETERLFAAHKRQGSVTIGDLRELPPDLMDALGGSEMKRVSPERWAFLDTETTGLLAPDTHAFLIGVGRITREGFRIRQFFTRSLADEASALVAVYRHLADFDVLITFNGKTYDVPLLNSRYARKVQESPLERLCHFDLLHGAHRVWKRRLKNCKLTQLEREVLGFHRQGDLASELIPYVYFEYLRSQEAERLIPVFHHNAMDILTLACLMPIVPQIFRNPQVDALSELGIHRGEDLFNIAGWLTAARRFQEALPLLERAAKARIPDSLLFRALWQTATLQKKLGRLDAAMEVFDEISSCRNEFRVRALEELAKHFERRVRDHARAAELTRAAASIAPSERLCRRAARLQRLISNSAKRRARRSRLTPI